MLNIIAAMAVFTFQSNTHASELVHTDTTGDVLYVVEGSIISDDKITLATVVRPLGEYGFMSMRVEMDCSAYRYRPTVVSFYNQDGSLRRSTDMSVKLSPDAGWATRNAGDIAGQICS